MALLQSLAMMLCEQELALQLQEAEACYAIIASWTAKLPVIAPIVELPAIPARKEDTKPFGYDYSQLPSRNADRQKRWSEL